MQPYHTLNGFGSNLLSIFEVCKGKKAFPVGSRFEKYCGRFMGRLYKYIGTSPIGPRSQYKQSIPTFIKVKIYNFKKQFKKVSHLRFFPQER